MTATARNYERFFRELRGIGGWRLVHGRLRRRVTGIEKECPLTAVANRRRRVTRARLLRVCDARRAAIYLGVQRHWKAIADAADGLNLRGPGFARDATRARLLRTCRLRAR